MCEKDDYKQEYDMTTLRGVMKFRADQLTPIEEELGTLSLPEGQQMNPELQTRREALQAQRDQLGRIISGLLENLGKA